MRRQLFLAPLDAQHLEARTLLAADFGDAPSPYSVLIAENGARHEAIGPTLGATRDGEADGAHSSLAAADGSDEDGVTFGIIRVGALDATVTVNVQGGDANLDAWIDFNGDGNWGGPNEQIFASTAIASGNHVLRFSVPSNAIAGSSFARFRLSTQGNLGPKGVAADGEVEDYAITIASPVAGSLAFDVPKTISTTPNGPRSVAGADIDNDGDQDILTASHDDDEIAWYENNGSQQFSVHKITTQAPGASFAYAVDLDTDGDQDVLVVAPDAFNSLLWFENDGSQNFVRHSVTKFQRLNFTAAFPADMDGDGDLDIVTSAVNDDTVDWYENDGNQQFAAHRIDRVSWEGLFSFAAVLSAVDFDRDGDLDILYSDAYDIEGGGSGSFFRWYENNGNQTFTSHRISYPVIPSPSDLVTDTEIADLDSDGDADILLASTWNDYVGWYENDGNGSFTFHSISTSAFGPISVFPTDIDGDGDQDILATERSNGGISCYENDGNQHFARRVIGEGNGWSTAIAADVDGDRDLDILDASFDNDKVSWYQQNARPVVEANAGSSLAEGTRVKVSKSFLSVADSDNSPDEVIFSIVSPPAHGQLELSNVPGARITQFSQADINDGGIFYQHDGSETTSDSFTFMLGDGVVSGVSGGRFHLTITPASGAPVLDTSLNPTLTAINEDATAPGSTLVSSLVSGAVTDPDAGALRGIAVTTASNFNGNWQYSLDNGGTWTAMGTPTSSAARLLPNSARIRFLPKLDFNGTVQISYRAWDQTAGTAGGTLMVSGNRGGAKTLSFAQETAKLTVNPVNDKPVLGRISGSIGYVHNAATAIVVATFATVTDVDSTSFDGGRLRVRITDGASSSNRLAIGAGFTIDAQGNVNQGTTTIGKRLSSGFGTNELVITFKSAATNAIVQQLLRAITFKTVGGAAGQRKVIFTISDGDGGLSTEATKTVNVS
jgi:hypothetical protein